MAQTGHNAQPVEYIEHAVVVEHAVGSRLLSAQRLVLSWATLFGDALRGASLAAHISNRLFIAVARFSPERHAPDVEARFSFWAERSGGVPVALSDLDKRSRGNFQCRIDACEHRSDAADPRSLPGAVTGLLAAMGVKHQHLDDGAAPVLSLEASFNGAVTFQSPAELVVRTVRLPPIGDRLVVSLAIPGRPTPVSVSAKVTMAKAGVALRGGPPSSFVLTLLDAMPEVLQALEAVSRTKPKFVPPTIPPIERRAAPRVAVNVPAVVKSAPQPVRVVYATEQELHRDYVTNLSSGGAFVRATTMPLLHAPVTLSFELPDGTHIEAAGEVVTHQPHGFGVQFTMADGARAKMAAIVARFAARPKRAMVLENDPLTREAFSSELRSRGFEVKPIAGGGLKTLLAELPITDVLVTDLMVPGLAGDALIERARKAEGGHRVTLVVLSTHIGLDEAFRLCSLGVDEVIDKGSGLSAAAEFIEQAMKRRAETLGSPELSGPAGLTSSPSAITQAEVPLVQLRYATAQAVADIWPLLAVGGVFAQTEQPLPLQTEVRVELTLPDGKAHRLGGTVVSVERGGMGIELASEVLARQALDEAVGCFMPQSESSVVLQRSAMRMLAYLPTESRVLQMPDLESYQILSLLGSGGMSEVYYARAVAGPVVGQLVALKRLKPRFAALREAVELFASEATLSLRLDHRHIVKSHQVGGHGAEQYLVMEAIDGRDLAQLVRRCRERQIPLPVDFACALVAAVLDALRYVHSATDERGKALSIVHCDVSASNVFVSRSGEVKLADFGLARSALLPGGNEVRGKPPYLSPEVLEGQVTVAADLWAANVLLYELLTLKRPFVGETQGQMFEAIRQRKFEGVRAARPEVSVALEGTVHRGFERSLSRRFESAQAFGDALATHFDPNVGTPLALAAVIRGLFG